MATYKARHRVRCPHCQQLFSVQFSSEVSQSDADAKAESTVYDELARHIETWHPDAKP